MIFEFIRNLGAFIVTLGILVAVHEWGHFWVARRCGVKVQRFSIGFGKALWRREDKLGTEYVIAAIPLGGYVKMLDERVEQVSQEELPMAFNRQHVLKRIAIIAAGPMVNFLFAIFVLFIAFMVGQQSVKPVIGEVSPSSIAQQAGLRSGMIINEIGGRQTIDWEAVNYELVSHIGDSELVMRVDTNKGFEQDITLNLQQWQFDQETQTSFESLGFSTYRPRIYTELAVVDENSPGYAAGLRKDDRIIAIDGTSFEKWEQIVKFIQSHPGKSVVMEIERDGQNMQLTATFGSKQTNGNQYGFLGVSPKFDPWPEEYVFEQQYGPVDAFVAGTKKTWRLMTLSVEMIGKLFTGDVSVKNLSGPISIAQGAGNTTSYGFVYFLGFLALISVNLGIINLFPLPVLDGGHLLYYFIELFTGRPVSESVQEIGFKIGGIVLLMLMFLAIFNDFARL